ncbi:MAG: hydrogenase maturation protease [Desulfurococcaceae archaeon]
MLQDNEFSPEQCTIFSHNTLILGVGSPLRSDDNAGLLLCDLLAEKGVECVKCEYGLENCFDVIIERKPRTLVIVDAAFFEKGKPGDVVLVTEENLVDTVQLVTTHNIPVRLVLEVIKRTTKVERAYLIGVYPKTMEIGFDVSSEVRNTIEKLANVIVECLNRESNG